MKFKFTLFHLFSIVLIQIILIDAVLIFFFFKKIDFNSKSKKKVPETGTEKVVLYKEKDGLLDLIRSMEAVRIQVDDFKIPDRRIGE